MRREEDFKPISRSQKIFYIYKKFGLIYLFKNYYIYAVRIFFAVIAFTLKKIGMLINIIKYKPLKIFLTKKPTGRVSIVIPFKDGSQIIQNCVESILQKTTYKNYEIVLVNNQSVLTETTELLNRLKLVNNVKVFEFDETFNYARLHNVIISKIQTEFVLFLNNDTEVIDPDWLGHMVDIIENNKKVGAVGPLLLFHNNTIQHAGISLGVRYGLPYHEYEGLVYKDTSSLPKAICNIKEVSALTGACLLTRVDLYKDIGGMDEVNLKIAFNDIDFCLKLYERGYHNIFTPNVCLYHYESYTRGLDYLDADKSIRLAKESSFFMKKWFKYKIDIFVGFDTAVDLQIKP